jgi:hypothetical protein
MFKFEIGEVVLVGQMKHKRKIIGRFDTVASRGTNIYNLEGHPPAYEYELAKKQNE